MKTYYQLIVSSLITMLLTGCFSHIPKEVRSGETLPTTLEMCHSVFIDANDTIYNKDLEIKHLQAEIEELKKAKK